MQVQNAIKKLERAGFTVTPDKYTASFTATKQGFRRYIRIYRNGGEYSESVSIVELRTKGHEDDIQRDYNAGTFCDNVSQAIRLVNC